MAPSETAWDSITDCRCFERSRVSIGCNPHAMRTEVESNKCQLKVDIASWVDSSRSISAGKPTCTATAPPASRLDSGVDAESSDCRALEPRPKFWHGSALVGEGIPLAIPTIVSMASDPKTGKSC
eukprot:1916409-Rhodomonas_salina.3